MEGRRYSLYPSDDALKQKKTLSPGKLNLPTYQPNADKKKISDINCKWRSKSEYADKRGNTDAQKNEYLIGMRNRC